MEENYTTDYRKRKLKSAVDNILKVSTIPVTLSKVLKVVDNERSTNQDLVDAIEHDQALTSRIVGIANSSFYGFQRQIKSVQRAISVLGFNMVRNLTISATLFKFRKNGDLAHLKDLWRHSFEVAVVSGMIADRTGVAKKEDAFLAGLINDLGRAILYQLFSDVYVKISSYGKTGLLLREEETFGASHSEVGKWFVEKYRFPKECALALEHHHSPEVFLANYRNGTLQIIPTVYIADTIVSMGKEGFEFDLVPSKNHTKIMESIYLDKEGIRAISEEFETRKEGLESFFEN